MSVLGIYERVSMLFRRQASKRFISMHECQRLAPASLNVFPEFPNTLPPQDLKGALSLAASEFAPVLLLRIRRQIKTQGKKTPVRATRRKTGIYNTSGWQGQTHKSGRQRARVNAAKESIFQNLETRTGTRLP